MSNPINSLSGLNGVNGTSSVDTTGNIQLLFAELQLELAKENKTAAYDKITAIQEKQKDSKNVSEIINILRSYKGTGDSAALTDEQKTIIQNMKFSDGKNIGDVLGTIKTVKDPKTTTNLATDIAITKATGANTDQLLSPTNFFKFMRNNSDFVSQYKALCEKYGCVINFQGEVVTDDKVSSYRDMAVNSLFIQKAGLTLDKVEQLYLNNLTETKEIDISAISEKLKKDDNIELMITTLSSYQESVTSSVQQEMIFVSDFMGQYNSYLQGASSQVSKNSDVLTALARG